MSYYTCQQRLSDSLIVKQNKTELIVSKMKLKWPITFQDLITNLVFIYLIDLEYLTILCTYKTSTIHNIIIDIYHKENLNYIKVENETNI